MCGITGILHFDRERTIDTMVLKQMMDSVEHRGPDAEGSFIQNNLGLGHRRLSIIDLDSGIQPMTDDRYTLTFNGEIYNYLELRDELENLGHVFKTNSDTEVILKAYRHWGTECQNRFNGMWAFALWDEQDKTLFVSRDRLGEKPLYYSNWENSFLFGSEIKSLLRFGVPTKPNFEVLELYLTLGYIPAPYTYYKNISSLKPGHFLLIKDSGISELCYWDLPEIDETNMLTDKNQVNEQFKDLLTDAVKLRMRSDVDFGAFLSGGLDSSSIVALMAGNSTRPIQTFTIGFDDKRYDERSLAQDVASKYNTKHHARTVEQDSFEDSITRVLKHYDQPFGDSSAIPTGYVSKYARQKVKMVLTGDGGDEVLSGYTMYQGEKFANKYGRLPSFIAKGIPSVLGPSSKLVKGDVRYKINRAKNVMDAANLSFEDRLISKLSWSSSEEVKNLLKHIKSEVISTKEFLNDFFNGLPVQDPFYKLMYFHFKVSLPDDMLTKVDRMSMAHSLETRVPFLDHRLVEYMVGVHRDIKMPGMERKAVLRNSIGNLLPDSVLNAPKKGFNVPLREWFKDKSFNKRLESLSKEDFGLNGQVIGKIVDDNRSGKTDLGNFIWMLMVLQKWHNSNPLLDKSHSL